MAEGTGKKLAHRDRKNPRSHEEYLERNKARNADRPKQVWNEETKSWDNR
jgi:hypothetical protein